jgi:hypothetical protein
MVMNASHAAVAVTERRNIHSLSLAEKCALMRREFTGANAFQRIFGADVDHVECDIGPLHIELREHIERLLMEKGLISKPVVLEELHDHVGDDWRAYSLDDGVNKISTQFYETDNLFRASYHRLMRDILRGGPFKKPFWFQAIPTIRLQCPNARNGNYYPRYHNDICFGHPPQEINIWIPLTQPRAPQHHGFRLTPLANSVGLLDRFDFDLDSFIRRTIEDQAFVRECEQQAPEVTTPFGKAILFDSRCIHTTEILRAHTRVSLDVRVVLQEDFDHRTVEYQGTGRRKIVFAPGGCYDPLSSDQI